METRRWFNQSQPQTMQIAVFLLYAQAVVTLLFGGDSDFWIWAMFLKLGVDFDALRGLITALFIVGSFLAAMFIANERKVGYRLGVAVAGLAVGARLFLMLTPTMNHVGRLSLNDLFARDIVGTLFDVALLALLLHPQSRSYERIWFK